MTVDAVRHRIGLLSDLFLAAAFADGHFADREREYIRKLGAALGLDEEDFRDLTLDPEGEAHRRSFIELARVPLPLPDDLRW